MNINILKVTVSRGWNDMVAASVIARNANGEIIVGNTGMVDPADFDTEVSFVVSHLDSTQKSFNNRTTVAHKAKKVDAS